MTNPFGFRRTNETRIRVEKLEPGSEMEFRATTHSGLNPAEGYLLVQVQKMVRLSCGHPIKSPLQQGPDCFFCAKSLCVDCSVKCERCERRACDECRLNCQGKLLCKECLWKVRILHALWQACKAAGFIFTHLGKGVAAALSWLFSR